MKKIILNKPKKQIKSKSFDYFIILIFILSIISPIIAATSQQYIVQYGDDISTISWAKSHSVFDIFTSKLGAGYRPIMNLFYALGYTLWGSEAKYFYLFSGILFACGMVFLYLIGKTLHGRIAGITAVLLYLFLDASFILISKINFIVTTGEIFFITSALYFAIKYINTNDNKSKYLAIILSAIAFLTKEPSILIIPTVILTYLYFSKKLDKKYIIVCIIPFIYMFIEMIFISPDVGSGSTNLVQRITNNAHFYFNIEIDYQFRTPYLLGISLVLASYLISYKNMKKEILVCVVWFIIGISPFLITQQPVQPTYLAEANLGMVLLIGIVVGEGFKKLNWITLAVIIGLILQTGFIQVQISSPNNPNSNYIKMQINNMSYYNKIVSDNQNTFLETMLEIKNVPTGEKIYYISDETRTKYGGYQITEDFFKEYLCLKDMCNTNIVTNYSEAKYIILPSTLDIQIFQKEYPNEKLQIINQIQHNSDYGFILKKI